LELLQDDLSVLRLKKENEDLKERFSIRGGKEDEEDEREF
jgi:hypothetical protein